MVTDPVADLLTRIRNAQTARHRYVEVYASRLNRELLELIAREGFIDKFEEVEGEGRSAKFFKVRLKYYPDGAPAIASAVRVSKPGRRVYKGASELGRVRQGLGIAIVSTSKGVMTDREARRSNVGGEVMAVVA